MTPGPLLVLGCGTTTALYYWVLLLLCRYCFTTTTISLTRHFSTISPTTTTTTRVFPLKGKLLNVRDASKKQLLGNAEVQNIMKIMGLKLDTKYVNSDDAWWWYSCWYSCWNFHDRPHYANTSSEHGVALIVVLNVLDV